MRPVELTAFHVRIPLKKTIRHASHSRTSNDTLLVRCRLDDGTVGWGEGLPRPYVTGETIDTAFAHVQATDWSETLDASFNGLADAVRFTERLKLDAIDPPTDVDGNTLAVRECFGNTVLCAVELALLDAVGRVEGAPLSKVTELVPEAAAVRESRDRVQYSGAITSESPRKQIASAVKMRLMGFHQLKVKVGTAGIDDARALRRVRRIVGGRVDLRIDANEAWRPDEVAEKLAPLVTLGISSLEQPVRHADVDALADVRDGIAVPIMLDESLCSIEDAYRAIERGTCDLFNIRLSKCGGFTRSLKLAATAERAGLGYQLGCQVGETGILSAAGRHFACSVGGIRYLEGSYDRYLVRERLTKENLTFGWKGFAPAINRPGLGVTIDPKALARVVVRERNLDARTSR